jgi:hypothetical protein
MGRHDADLLADPEFRATLVGCLKWGTRLAGPGVLRGVTSVGLRHTVLALFGFRLGTVLCAGAVPSARCSCRSPTLASWTAEGRGSAQNLSYERPPLTTLLSENRT